MASLTKKIIKGRPYYYLRECQRVDGKPKIVWQQYLGSAANLIRRLQEPDPLKAVVREFGASSACVDIARQLDLASIIDRHVPKRDSRGPSVGQYLLIAALNRCLAPRSKARLGAWYEQTVLPRLLGVRAEQLTSQRFWDNMDRVDSDSIVAIERDVSATAVKHFGLDLRCLLFDATNFFTFIDSFNTRGDLTQRGHSKEGRDNLRILGLALLVTADGDVPLFHHTYAGNQHDAVTFRSITDELSSRCRKLADGACDITLVFDKGNNAEDNLQAVAKEPFHFVGSLVPTHHKDLLAVPRAQMRRLDPAQLPAAWAWRTHKKIFGIERTVLCTFNRPLFDAQVKTLRREIRKRKRRLETRAHALDRYRTRPRGKAPTLAGTQKRVDAILAGRHMKDLFHAEVKLGSDTLPVLTWRFDNEAWKTLRRTLLGKTILFTDRDQWTNEQIVLAYRAQHHVEAAFRRMKDPRFLTFRPIFHWTDQKLRVHALYCVMALMILSLLRRKLSQKGIPLSIARMTERLADIREIALLFDSGVSRPPRARTVLSDTDPEQKKMFEALGLDRFRAK